MSPVVTKFLHTRMRVDDLDKTVTFEKVFGLEVSRRHESPRGSKLVFSPSRIAPRKLSLPISWFRSVQVQEDLMHLAFEVESMDEFSNHLEKVGYSLVMAQPRVHPDRSLPLWMPLKAMRSK